MGVVLREKRKMMMRSELTGGSMCVPRHWAEGFDDAWRWCELWKTSSRMLERHFAAVSFQLMFRRSTMNVGFPGCYSDRAQG